MLYPWPWLIYLLFVSLPKSHQTYASTLGERSFSKLSSSQISSLVTSPDPIKSIDPSKPSSHLSKILIPRVSGTANNTLVRNYIVSTLKALKWHVEEDSFTGDTPIGTRNFTNIIATKDPTAPRRVILSAHFDSKYFATYPQNQFVGATDSAAPCAMMLDLAEALNPLLDKRQQRLEDGLEDDEDVSETTLQLVFFDGEEAFVEWTDTDSVYGARHLADKWSNSYLPPNPKRRLLGPSSTITQISTIEHLILLDLLGAPNPSLRSFFLDTGWLFDAIASAEYRLGESGAFVYGGGSGKGTGTAGGTGAGAGMAPGKWKSWFKKRTGYEMNLGYVGDDHVPFLKKGVSVLHLIAEPFPVVWHTLRDDASALDIPTMRRWNLILRVFMSEYLNLRPDDKKARDSSVERSASDLC